MEVNDSGMYLCNARQFTSCPLPSPVNRVCTYNMHTVCILHVSCDICNQTNGTLQLQRIKILKRRQGIPRIKWPDDVQQDAVKLAVKIGFPGLKIGQVGAKQWRKLRPTWGYKAQKKKKGIKNGMSISHVRMLQPSRRR